MLRALRHRLEEAALPAIFLVLTGYFGWNAVHGPGGLQAQAGQEAALARAQTAFAGVDATRAQWEARIAALAGPQIAPDMLDAQARRVLNLADPDDYVVDLNASKK